MNKSNAILHKAVFFIFVLFHCLHLEAQGEVFQGSIDSEILNDKVSYQVYLPDNYDFSLTSFPILYLLHGHGGSERDWFEPQWGNMNEILDSLIVNGKIPPMVAVTVDVGNSWYVDSKLKMESFYLNEFIPHIEKTYRVNDEDRLIAGDSMGGYGALRFSLIHPDWFEAVILLSPAAYEPYPPLISSSRKVEAFSANGSFSKEMWRRFSYTRLWDNLVKSAKKPVYYLSVGDDDAFNIVPVVTQLQQTMLKDKIPNELRIVNGGHNWEVWRTEIAGALSFIYGELKLQH